MTDVLTASQRSYCMAQIHGKHTKPEHMIRKLLFGDGFRYRLHDPRLPGKPDLVFPRYRAAVFVHGCFWHGHTCRLFKWPTSNREFWENKINRNQRNDALVLDRLLHEGWRVLTVWECALKGTHRLQPQRIAALAARWIRSNRRLQIIEGAREAQASPMLKPMLKWT